MAAIINSEKHNQKDILFYTAIISIMVVRTVWLYANQLELYADEAQYWHWSKNLALGYYSKPPMIALFIKVSTFILDDCEFGVRFLSPILHGFTALFVYLTAKKLNPSYALIAGLLYFSMPGVIISSGLMSTDAILLFFWAMAVYVYIAYPQASVMLGIIIGLGMLTKYHMAFFLISIACYQLHIIKSFKFLYSKQFLLTNLIAILTFSPNIIWNIQNGFANFSHTSDLFQGPNEHQFSFIQCLKFLRDQFAVFGPINFMLLLIAFCNAKKTNQWLLFYLCIVPLFLISLIAFKSRAHANWAIMTYVTGSILITCYDQKWIRNLLRASIVLHLLINFVMMIHQPILNYYGVQYHDVFQRLRGGRLKGDNIIKLYNNHKDAIFAIDNRREIALAKYYTRNSGIKIVKWNNMHKVNDHFALTTDLNQFISKDVIYISDYVNMPYSLQKMRNVEVFADKVELLDIIDFNRKQEVILLKNFKGY